MILMEALVQQRKSLILTLLKQRQDSAWVFSAILIIVICLLTKKKSVKLIMGSSTFQLIIVYKAYPKDLVLLILGAIHSREVSLKGNVYDFSVNYSSTDKSDI